MRREASASPIGKMLLVHQGGGFEIAIPGNDDIKVKPMRRRIRISLESFDVCFFLRGTHRNDSLLKGLDRGRHVSPRGGSQRLKRGRHPFSSCREKSPDERSREAKITCMAVGSSITPHPFIGDLPAASPRDRAASSSGGCQPRQSIKPLKVRSREDRPGRRDGCAAPQLRPLSYFWASSPAPGRGARPKRPCPDGAPWPACRPRHRADRAATG